jgi:hypothetical protein
MFLSGLGTCKSKFSIWKSKRLALDLQIENGETYETANTENPRFAAGKNFGLEQAYSILGKFFDLFAICHAFSRRWFWRSI